MLSLTLSNVGTAPILLDRRFIPGPDETAGQEITLLAVGPGERPLPFLIFSQPSPILQNDIVKLSLKESTSRNIFLSHYFSMDEPGEYLVQAIYNTTKINTPERFWRGRTVSEPVTFFVKEK